MSSGAPMPVGIKSIVKEYQGCINETRKREGKDRTYQDIVRRSTALCTPLIHLSRHDRSRYYGLIIKQGVLWSIAHFCLTSYKQAM